MQNIILKDVGGIGTLSGIDQDSCHWTEFWADDGGPEYLQAKCFICGRSLINGWMCLDKPKVCCHQHVDY